MRRFALGVVVGAAIVLLLVATGAVSHARWKHPAGKLDAPLVHEATYLRAEIREARAERCLGTPRFVTRYAWQVAVWNRLAHVRELRARLEREWRRESRCLPWWIAKQIAAASWIARNSAADPWPNCPDPHDGSGVSWSTTVKCENRAYYELYGLPRAWLDSPGYYRCGLQFDPMWERRFGRLCP